jgi:hypothetical protein
VGDAVLTVRHVNTWDEFKRAVLELQPATIFYISQPHPLKNPSPGLRLTFYHNQDLYVFIDSADGAFLIKTKIPVTNHIDKINAEIREQDIREFLSNNFPLINLVSFPPFMY